MSNPKWDKAALSISICRASEEFVSEELASDRHIVKGSETILVVDDEDLVLDAAAQLIEALGYTVFRVKSGFRSR